MTGAASSTSVPNLSSILWGCLWLTLALLAVFPVFAGFGYVQHGTTGVLAASIALGVCWLGAAAALAVAGLVRSSELALVGFLGGMFLRMGLPLGVGLMLSLKGGELVEAGIFIHLVGYYLFALVVETTLSLRFVSGAKVPSRANVSKAT